MCESLLEAQRVNPYYWGGNINYVSTVAGKWEDNVVVTELLEVVLWLFHFLKEIEI